MAVVSIIYYSGTGHTAMFAKYVLQGASSIEGVQAKLIGIDENDIIKGRYKNEGVISQLNESDAIIFGCPTYFGGCAAQFKAFADATLAPWLQQTWRNKLSAGFTVSGTPSGDKFSTLQYLQTFAMQHGMIWIGTGELPMQPDGLNRLASWNGAIAQSNRSENPLPAEDLLTAKVFGKRVADLAMQLLFKKL
jgi:NAD(P)H dehydrogenase (quinone)